MSDLSGWSDCYRKYYVLLQAVTVDPFHPSVVGPTPRAASGSSQWLILIKTAPLSIAGITTTTNHFRFQPYTSSTKSHKCGPQQDQLTPLSSCSGRFIGLKYYATRYQLLYKHIPCRCFESIQACIYPSGSWKPPCSWHRTVMGTVGNTQTTVAMGRHLAKHMTDSTSAQLLNVKENLQDDRWSDDNYCVMEEREAGLAVDGAPLAMAEIIWRQWWEAWG